jgi:hypothetical protein
MKTPIPIPEAVKALAKRSKAPRREDTSRPAQTTAGIGHNRGPPIEQPIERAASTIDQFCSAHCLSKPMLYKLWQQGIGPKFMFVGSRRLISSESAAAWRTGLERQSQSEEVERRSKRASAISRARFHEREEDLRPPSRQVNRKAKAERVA